jgi:hypothetical protein
MIDESQVKPALEALRSLIVHAKVAAGDARLSRLAALLNDMEMLPEYLASDDDQTEEFRIMLEGIAQTQPECAHILKRYQAAELIPT